MDTQRDRPISSVLPDVAIGANQVGEEMLANRPGHLCAALALLGMTCSFAGHAQTPPPFSGKAELLLAVRINGAAQPDSERIISLNNGRLAANAEALQHWRLRIPAVTPIPFEGQSYYPLDAIPGLRYQLDQATQELQVTIPPAAFLPSGISEATALQRAPSVSPGGFFNYDLLTQRNSVIQTGTQISTQTSNALLEAGVFNQQGVGTSTFLWQNPATPQHFTRLETAWTRDDPWAMSRFQAGDNITSAGTWGRAVRFGGLQSRSNFDTQPGFITFPQPGVAGIATLPSTVDVYVNNARHLSQGVQPGPFEINNVPVINGAGDVQLVVTDLLGRQQVITEHYYASRSLLREGLSDYSYEAGVVRTDYGLYSNHYGQSFGAATYRHGVSDRFTSELRAEAMSGQQTAGLGGFYLWPAIGTAQAALAASHGPDGKGALLMAGIEHVSQGVSWSVQEQGGSRRFTELGWVTNGIRPRRIQSLFLGFPVAWLGGSLSLSGVSQQYWGQASTQLGSINYGRSLSRDFFFTAYGTRSTTSGAAPSYLIGFTISTYLGDRTSASLQANRQKAGGDGILQVQKNLPEGDGFGYRMMADQGLNKRQEADGSWQTGIGAYNAGVSHQANISSARLGASGGMAFLGGTGFLSRRIDDSFVIVNAGGYPGVRVYNENRLAGATDSQGKALIPHLLPYQQNHISLEEGDLPIEAQLDTRELLITPALRSGAYAEFPVRTVHGGTLTIVLEDGSYFPVGGKVVILDQDEEYPVGQHGEVFLPNLGKTNRLFVVWEHQSCEIILDLPPNPPPLADLGRRTCRGVKP
ncbi:MAG TPA: fimbria/pilus outer membrane usher protein [Gallionellaceae bacterium]